MTIDSTGDRIGHDAEARICSILSQIGCTNIVRYQRNSRNDQKGIDIAALYLDVPIHVQVKTTQEHARRWRNKFRSSPGRRAIIVLMTRRRTRAGVPGNVLADEAIITQFLKQYQTFVDTGSAW